MSEAEKPVCVVCAATEEEKPIVQFRYRGRDAGICPDCLPTMIHHRETVMERLDDQEHRS